MLSLGLGRHGDPGTLRTGYIEPVTSDVRPLNGIETASSDIEPAASSQDASGLSLDLEDQWGHGRSSGRIFGGLEECDLGGTGSSDSGVL